MTAAMNDPSFKLIQTTVRSDELPVPVDALFLSPPAFDSLLVLGHGAGAGIHHAFMEQIAQGLAGKGIATFRYQFPYMQQGKKRPDMPAVLTATVRSAVAAASEFAGSVPLFAGGKSMGGRMSSQAEAKGHLDRVEGLVFFGFPLHPPGTPSTARADHLDNVRIPMLFLQGTRDKLADLELMTGVCQRLGSQSTLHIIEGGDHSFHLPKSTGKSDEDAFAQIVAAVYRWKTRVLS